MGFPVSSAVFIKPILNQGEDFWRTPVSPKIKSVNQTEESCDEMHPERGCDPSRSKIHPAVMTFNQECQMITFSSCEQF